MRCHPLYICYYSLASGYEAEARELLKTLDAFNLPCDVVGLPSAGSWQANTQAKANFIRAMMNKHAGRPLVWLDADARVKRDPALFDGLTCDFAAHWKDDWELLSGTLYFSGSEASVDLVDDWIDECARHPEVYDQKCLDNCLKRLAGLSVTKLPPSYTAIFDAGMCPVGSETILHTQASRRLKGLVA